MQILRASDGVETPWKNGGDVTREVAAWPPGTGASDFDWRVSIATVSRGGPFSVFPGVDRELAVLEGVLRLSIHGRDELLTRPESPSVRFPGDVATSGEPHGAWPVTDLNVMTRRGKFSSRIARAQIRGRYAIAERAGVAFIVALAPMKVGQRGQDHSLNLRDVVRLEPSDADVTVTAASAAYLLCQVQPSGCISP
jgi:environmental stress-induced protein Ves